MRTKLVVYFIISVLHLVTATGVSFEIIFNDILPYRFHPKVLIESDTTTNSTRLYAKQFETVDELVAVLIGDVDNVVAFKVDEPYDYALEDYEVSESKNTTTLNAELEDGLYTKLLDIYLRFHKIYSVLQEMDKDDFLAIYDHLYANEDPREVFERITMGDKDYGGAGTLKAQDFEELDPGDDIHYPVIPFVEIEDSGPVLVIGEDEGEVQTQLLKLILSIPIIIVKLILKIFWYLIELFKYLELLETKICLLIIKIIEKICKTIWKIKNLIKAKIQAVLWELQALTRTKELLEKLKVVTYLILKNSRVLSWELQDILYRYQWKLIFAIKNSEKKSLLIAMYFKELIFGKLDKKFNLEDRQDFFNFDKDIYDEWDDKQAFKDFAHYIYKPSGIDPKKSNDLKKAFDNIKDDPDYYEKLYNPQDYIKDDNVEQENEFFDLKEQYGFDSVNIRFGKDVALKSSNKNK